MIKEIAFTSFRVTDMARAREFYEARLGLTPGVIHSEKWTEYQVGSGFFIIQNLMGDQPSGQRGLIAFEVDDLEHTVADLRAVGVPFLTETVIESPVCHLVIVHDPDGNPVCLHKQKTLAA